jgi:putative cardiolipin synthase
MARLMLIKKAKTSIDLTYYIFQDSETSRILIDELRAALRRGVNVRLMVDGSGSIAAAAKNFFKEIQVLNEVLGGKIYDTAGNVIGNAKFEAIEINPTFNARAGIKGWYDKVIGFISGKKVSNDDFSIFHRAHDKILLIDANSPENSMAIIGGRNISNHYYKIGTEEERDATYNDLDILVKHIAYTETTDEKTVIKNVLLDHFNRLYFYSANKNFEDFIFKQDRIGAADVLSEIRHTRNQIMRTEGAELGAKMAKMEQDDFLNKNFDQGYISFLDEIENLVRKNSLKNMTYTNNQNSIMKNMWIQVEKAEKDILICSPYIYLTDKEMDFLVSWLAQNPSRKFRLITNSTSTSDNLFAQAMVEYFVMPKLMKKLTDAKIPIKQFEVLAYGNTQNKEFGGKVAQGKLHAKFWMVDNYAMGIGTSNFDPVSRLTNSEIVANIFPTKGTQSIESLNIYYQSLKQDSAMWNSPEFVKSKYRKELKKKLIIQSVIARIIKLFKLLPQN